MSEMQTQWFLNSTTVQGVLLTIVPTIVAIIKIFGIDVGVGEQQTIIDGVAGLFGIAGAILAIYGRFKATKPVTLGWKKK